MTSLLYLLTLIFGACFAGDIVINNKKFPENFLFGCATSSYQIEGGWDADGKGPNVWDNVTHEKTSFIIDGSNGDISCDSYHKYKEDILLLKEMGANFYRFSISWPRVLPTGFIDNINQPGVDYYKNLIKELKSNQIEPVITIYHNDLPQSIQDLGGIKNPEFINWFTAYARFCFETFGDDIRYWLTINEPYVACTVGFISLVYVDGIDDYICMKNMLMAHANAWHIYHDDLKGTGKVGIVLNSNWFEPETDSAEDLEASERTMQFIWGWLGHPLYHGDYPEIMKIRVANRSKLEGFNESRIQELTNAEIEYVKGTNDFFAFNSYTSSIVRSGPDAPIGTPSHNDDLGVYIYQPDEWRNSSLSWLKVTPWGMRKLLNWIKNEYSNPPMLISENGVADGPGQLNDTIRYNYIRDYLSNIRDAMEYDGANVIGYSYWALLDTFEWTAGYTAKFGLISVNFDDPARPRTRKMSSYYYEKIMKTKCLVDECEDEI
ncbi:unnamed protein product [Psylliodes chrysocephalus]|uniref:beta-glucosidase n=1 Tax=Psylliodes chrysocephalus TaxID=3402493 RepID=A0A9P0GMV5_9CUCU|nr:unnamed protein product [Psylliodes chrysocephala]